MKEILCARLPAALQCPDLGKTLAFYRDAWGFTVAQNIPGVFAVLMRESVTVQLWQRRVDMPAALHACRMLVDSLEPWQTVKSSPGQSPEALSEQTWGVEQGVSDCDGNRLLLVQSAPHAVRRRTRA